MKRYIYNLLSAIHRERAQRKLSDLESKYPKQEEKLNIPFEFRGSGHFKSISCMQNPDEISRLFKLVCSRKPKVIVEIGTAKGGALYLWCKAAQKNGTIVSVDLPDGEFGGGYPKCRIPFYESFKEGGQTVNLIRADSHDLKTVEGVRQALNGQKIDFLFIDGDHTYRGAKMDFEYFGPMVRSGGMIAFHDILPRADLPSIEVHQLWNEVKERYESQEIIGGPGSGRTIGCGVIFIQ
jgi:cephalosporin hydroxylase